MVSILSLALGVALAAPPCEKDVIAVKDRNLMIPVRVNPERAGEICELRLFVSKDQGKTWAQSGVAKAGLDSFAYLAPADGLYWFTLQVIGQKGQAEPADLSTFPPHLKVRVESPGATKADGMAQPAPGREVAELRARVEKLEKRLAELEARKKD